jgi:hypothetical protein
MDEPINRCRLGKLSKQKGKRGEREVAALFREQGFFARRGVQFQGGINSPDVVTNIPGLHVEVKRSETFQLYKSLEQAKADGGARAATVFHRSSNRPWVVCMTAVDFFEIADAWLKDPVRIKKEKVALDDEDDPLR